MDVTRATAATRVDENGLVNYAEVLGSELTSPLNFLSTWLEASVDSKTYNTFTVGGSGRGMYFMLPENKTLKINVSGVTGSVQLRYRTTTGGAGTVLGDFDTDLYLTTTNATTNIYLRATGAGTVSVTDVSVKEVTRNNVPRIDYTGGGCPHILAEPERTNLITASEDFTSNIYTATRCTITPNEAIAPNGTQTADLMTATGNDARLEEQVGSSGAEYTQSVYVKSAQVSDVDCQIDFAGLNTVTFTANQEWQRVNTTLTNTSYVPRFRLRILNSGDSIYVWGGQLEQGSYPTSYIPTSGSAVTRNQDQFTRDGISSLINDTEGVLFVEIAAFADYTTYRYMGLTDGSSDNRVIILYYNSSTRIRVLLSSGGTKYFDEYYTVTSIEDFHKVALKWKENDFALWIDGVERATDTSGLAPIGLNTVALDQAGGGNFYGKVKQLQVYDTALTDNQLIQLTGEAGTHFFESYSEMAETLTYTIQ
jgi:hypothetical protein